MMPAYGDVSNHVPNYDLHGHQHHREPFKDKSHLLTEDIRHQKWLEPPPAIKSRSELHQARQRARVPDQTYDFDGDGVVGQLDHFIGRSFDKDSDGRLSVSEHGRAKQALEDGFLDKYVRGLDSTGQAAGRGYGVQQRRGRICMADNAADASIYTYPPHHNAHVQPPHNTFTAMKLNRLAEAKGAGAALADMYAKMNAPIIEPQPWNHETAPRICPISSIRERAEADHQASRLRGGLLAVNTMVNPERELKAVGLEHVDRPLFATRGQLLETRKDAMKRECEELAQKAEEVCVPNHVRKTDQLIKEYEFRRPEGEPMTLTRLKDQRKRDKIEHELTHFGVGPREYPRFSDNPEVPWWRADAQGSEGGAAYPVPAMSRTVSEPVLKVTHVPFGHLPAQESIPDLPEAAYTTTAAGRSAASAAPSIGSKTVKRWTSEVIERGAERHKPRLFDGIQPVRVTPKDYEALDLTSSMEPIRNAALKQRADENRKALVAKKGKTMGVDLTQPLAGGVAANASPDGDAIDRSDRPKQSKLMTRAVARSEPTLHAALAKTEIPYDPRFFGSAEDIMRPVEETAVRTGGFQRFTAGDKQHEKTARSTRGGEYHSKGAPVPLPQ